MDTNTFITVDENGKEIVCEILFAFECTTNKKDYIVYTDNTLDENGHTKVYASIYDPSGKSTELEPVETDEEWDMIATVLNDLQNETV